MPLFCSLCALLHDGVCPPYLVYLPVMLALLLLAGWPPLPIADVYAIITFFSTQDPTHGGLALCWVGEFAGTQVQR